MSIQDTIYREFDKMNKRGWNKIYWAIDFHDTILPGMYTKDDGATEFYPDAIEALKILQERNDCVLILWTSSYEEYIKKHLDKLKDRYGIIFDYYNENPECPSDQLCDFSGKFYFNVLIDDKAGFNPEEHWKDVIYALGVYN